MSSDLWRRQTAEGVAIVQGDDSKVVGPCLTNGQIRARTFSPILTFAVFGGLLRNSTFSRSFVPFHPFSLSSACRAVALAAPMMALLGGGHVALAQDAAQLSGTVIDPSGAVVPSAVVTVKNLGTNATRDVTTNAQGSYTMPGLAPGQYEVSVPPTSGFGAFKARFEATVGGRQTVDMRLTANSSTSVEVQAETGVQVNSQTQELSQVVTAQQVSQLPSLTRNPYDFVALSGNVSSGDRTAGGGDQNVANRGVGFTINGQRSTGTEILLDGVENIAVFDDSVGIKVPIDAVHEFRVITTNPNTDARREALCLWRPSRVRTASTAICGSSIASPQ